MIANRARIIMDRRYIRILGLLIFGLFIVSRSHLRQSEVCLKVAGRVAAVPPGRAYL
jgi:hypothetical protein